MNAHNETFSTGIEIEIANDELPNYEFLPKTWENKEDGSCGKEFCSGILRSKVEIDTQVEAVCAGLGAHGASYRGKCGIHVHVGVKHIPDLSAKYRLYRFATRYEEIFFKILKPKECRKQYCLRLSDDHKTNMKNGTGFNICQPPPEIEIPDLPANSTPAQQEEHARLVIRQAELDAMTAVQRRSINTTRYYWLNCLAYSEHGTFEFRGMNTTFCASDIIGHVAVLQCMFNAAVNLYHKVPWDPCDSPEQFLKDLRIEDNTAWGQFAKEYVHKRLHIADVADEDAPLTSEEVAANIREVVAQIDARSAQLTPQDLDLTTQSTTPAIDLAWNGQSEYQSSDVTVAGHPVTFTVRLQGTATSW